MKTINNNQRAGFVRLLQAELKNAEQTSGSYYNFTRYTDKKDVERWENEDAKKTALALGEKNKFFELREEEKRIDEALDKASDTIRNSLRKYDEQEEKDREARKTALKLAIRDIWASADVEEAKKIVAKFVSA